MKKILYVITIAATLLLGSERTCAQTRLCFHDGSFKILQFTDSHLYYGDKLERILSMMDNVINTEKPDLIVFTGDNICQNGESEAVSLWKRFCSFLESEGVPYAIALGNHDSEFVPSLGRKEIYDLIREVGPHCINKDYAEGLSVYGAKDIPVYDATGEKVKSVVYVLDSNDYPDDPVMKHHSWYDWMHFDEIAWYRKTSAAYTAGNGGEPLPSVAFFHICVPEFKTVVERKAYFGHCYEVCCPPSMNSGFFLSAFECGDIMSMFVGHDHTNDFCGTYKEIGLCYGRQSGVDWSMPDEVPMGGRVVVLKEGCRYFDTWTRDLTGKGPVWNYPLGMYTEGISDFEPALDATVNGNGVAYRYYEGTEKDIEAGTLFSKKNLKEKGVKTNFSIPTEREKDYFGYEFDTYVYAPKDAQYDLNFNANEGAIIYLDGKRMVGEPGEPFIEGVISTYVNLAKGYHRIQIRYYEAAGKQKFTYDWRYSLEDEDGITDGMLFLPSKPDFRIK